ncbi:Golgi phosphoprotein 3 isoform 2 [Schistosoma japonicum]|uniref:Golgi phosphoprotein 3 n=1 Tax=Schistosoma japonicum TaxID=6182 RepID=C1LM69_SCHJA|nr:Golgi phosphoprotein 3 [Schistosoma japonicum]KAH8877847.1 Golgi phosphoprotein 3 [Schistosoma japonicum]KAH8877848.1 Golgi phosphoprotein 3 [Schistosoma japonicum]TNN21221.1 Golgi phosphoprotein 3 isoform 2 [Schistosoma japonicum]TNN21222.1 Golgi phosphoprotein 3 isoform 2 [Schistosoma japonicum]
MTETGEAVIVRRNVAKENSNQLGTSNDPENEPESETESKEIRLTLMEEVLLLGLKDREGYLSFWNDNVCYGLRGCILVELGLRNRIGLEPCGMRRKNVSSRNIVVKKYVPTGDSLLDEALKHINERKPLNTETWINYLSGETWNPVNLPLQLRNVRERIAKNLVEKRICTTEKQNFILFDMMTHPLVDVESKQRVISRIQDVVLNRWSTDIQKIDKRLLSLVLLSHCSDVLESALQHLADNVYDLARRRIDEALQLDFSTEANKEGSCEMLWAVMAALNS